jgi:hypothetical protein
MRPYPILGPPILRMRWEALLLNIEELTTFIIIALFIYLI